MQPKELLGAHAHIWNHIFNFINSFSLKCAIQLAIPDIIHNHNKPMTISELVDALNLDKAKADCLPRLMRILVHSGFFVKVKVPGNDQEEGYSLTPSSRLLIKDEPFSVTPFLLSMLDPVLTEPWHQLSAWFRNDRATPFEMAHGGRAFWEYASHDAKSNHLFNEGMASDARFAASMVITECSQVFEGIDSLVDVGGGTGTMAKAIGEAFPHLECIVLDLAHVVDGLQGNDKLSYIGGDMFEYIPPADTTLLKWILHDWSDEDCVKVLKKCKEAIPTKEKGGKVIIIDMVVNQQSRDHESLETQLFFDMLMMVVVTGRERSEKDWAKLFMDAGFTDYKITPILGVRSLIEVFP